MSTNTLKQALEIVYGDIKNINKRVKNIETASIGVLYNETIKSAVAYQDNVSANACPYALLNTLGGMSYKSENLCNIVSQSRTTQGITWNIIGDEISVQWDGTGVSNGPITLTNPITLKKGTYTSYAFDLASSWIGNIYLRGVNSLGQNVDFSFASTNNTTLRGITKTLDEDITFTNLWCSAVNVTSKYTFKIMIVRGSTTPTEYKPYFDGIRDSAVSSVISKDSNNTVLQTISIPSAIQALEGYGWGINDTCYNYIDFVNKKFIQKVGTRAYQSGDEEDTSVLTDLTTTYYELETPVETDISQYIDDNSIQVEANGTITFDNTYQQAIPYEYLYLEKVGANNE